MRLEVVAKHLLPGATVVEALPVVVAVHEEPFDMPPVRGLVVRKHGTPHPSDLLKLLYKAAFSKVAAYRDAVNTLVAEPFQRLAELLRTSKRVLAVLASKADVDVAYGAKHEIRASAP